MAASSARTQKPIGSTAWVASEKENIMQLIEQEMEEIEYPVRHELVWLNEHMAEIFSQDQLSVFARAPFPLPAFKLSESS